MRKRKSHKHQFVLTQGAYGAKPFYSCRCGVEECDRCKGAGIIDLGIMSPGVWGIRPEEPDPQCPFCGGKGYL